MERSFPSVMIDMLKEGCSVFTIYYVDRVCRTPPDADAPDDLKQGAAS